MNNGVNNSELTIEPVQEQQPVEAAPVVEAQPIVSPAVPAVAPVEPVAAPVVEAVASAPTVDPVVQAPVEVAPAAVEPAPAPSLGSNVKIAPVQSMYDENGQLIQQSTPAVPPVPVPPAPVPPPVLVQPVPPPPGEPPQIQIKQEETPVEQKEVTPEQNEPTQTVETIKQGKRFSLTPIFLIIIVGLIVGLIYVNNDRTSVINELKYQNIVVNTQDKKEDIDKNSTLIQDLYTKVSTTVREDLASQNLDEEMKRYLAFRQINSNMIYESNCNLFDRNKIYNYTCDQKTFKPNAFKEETLQLEIKKIFGENTKIDNGNIQLGRQCIGGYQYIAERGEYVQGQCIENNAVTISVKKNIVSAYRINDEVYIEEETKYISGNRGEIPNFLKDGIYIYKFKLDTNLNYAYISKTYKPKY